MPEIFVGLHFNPFLGKCNPVYAVIKRDGGKLLIDNVSILDQKEGILKICKDLEVKMFSFNILYPPDRITGYKLPKLRLNMYVEEIKQFISYSKRRRRTPVPVYSQSIYGNKPLPSKDLLEGLNYRFDRLSMYISGLSKLNILSLRWRVYPVDILDTIATSLSLYFYKTGRFEKYHIGGLEVIVPHTRA